MVFVTRASIPNARWPHSGRGCTRPCDPLRGQLLLHGVLFQARVETAEIDAVERLVLVEAREHVAHLAGRWVAMRLQALRADLLHHALHRRVDRCERAMLRL